MLRSAQARRPGKLLPLFRMVAGVWFVDALELSE
jgi:hypothetical protein